MKVGCCAYSYRDIFKSEGKPLEWFVEECSKLGLDGVELTSYYFSKTSDDYLFSLKRLSASCGLDIYATATGSKFTHPEENKRREEIENVKRWLDISQILGAPCLRVFGGALPEGFSEEEVLSWTASSLRQCASYGAKRGVVVALENHGGITRTAELVLALREKVNHEWLAINLDTGNYSKDPYREIQITAPYASLVHAKISTNSPQGRETLDYKKVVDILHKANYRGYLSIEYEEKEDPLTAIPKFAARLKEALKP